MSIPSGKLFWQKNPAMRRGACGSADAATHPYIFARLGFVFVFRKPLHVCRMIPPPSTQRFDVVNMKGGAWAAWLAGRGAGVGTLEGCLGGGAAGLFGVRAKRKQQNRQRDDYVGKSLPQCLHLMAANKTCSAQYGQGFVSDSTAFGGKASGFLNAHAAAITHPIRDHPKKKLTRAIEDKFTCFRFHASYVGSI